MRLHILKYNYVPYKNVILFIILITTYYLRSKWKIKTLIKEGKFLPFYVYA